LGVILNGAKRSEESRFSALRMTIFGPQLDIRQKYAAKILQWGRKFALINTGLGV
jgi:hypothetical protein